MIIKNLGLIDYKEAYQTQLALVESVRELPESETLIICSHPPVVTLGKKSTRDDLIGWEGDVQEIERGGKATYHGPSQVVIYPILDLKIRHQDIAGFLAAMENAMILSLKDYGISSEGNFERGKPDYTGVWIKHCGQKRKIASIGVAVKRWITYHGLAFNLYKDNEAFTGINPCGFTTETMISLEEVIDGQEKPSRSSFEQSLSSHLIEEFTKLRKS